MEIGLGVWMCNSGFHSARMVPAWSAAGYYTSLSVSGEYHLYLMFFSLTAVVFQFNYYILSYFLLI